MKHNNILSKLKAQVKLIESLITEGDHWPEDYRRKAINRIKLATAGKTPVYIENDITTDVDKLIAKFEPLSHKNSNLGYFLPIIRMFINYAESDANKRKEFIDKKFDNIVKMLGIISQDPSLELKFKDDIKQKWSLEDFEKHAAEIQDEITKKDASELASIGNSESTQYDVILIESYEELHAKFGGNKTGYRGQSEWCHANGDSTYDIWTNDGMNQFFVLAKKGWENIKPPNPKTTNAFDEYGTSLIAILVKVEDCELRCATLRWNHVIEPSETVPKTSVDKAFLGWGDLSKAVGFNVKAVVESKLKHIQDDLLDKATNVLSTIKNKLKNVTEITKLTFNKNERKYIQHIEIPDNVTRIGNFAFYDCEGLKSITIPDSVRSIGEYAFNNCHSLTDIKISDGVTSLGAFAFKECYSLKNVIIGNNVKCIEDYTFNNCHSLTNVTIGNSVATIGYGAFFRCSSLTNIVLPNSVTGIKDEAFIECKNLTSITIPDSVKWIDERVFYSCTKLTNVKIGNHVEDIGDDAFKGCTELTNLTIPDSVWSIGDDAFYGCNNLTNLTFEGKSLSTVRRMDGYPWGIKNPGRSIKITV